MQGNPREHATWLASRPRRFEEHAVRQLLTALRITQDLDTRPGFHLHIVHLAGQCAGGARRWAGLAAPPLPPRTHPALPGRAPTQMPTCCPS